MKLVFTILQICYYTGLLWYIYCDIVDEQGYNFNLYPSYIVKFGINKLPGYDAALLLMYWAFTTLSTVGFGDQYPSNEIEKAACIPIFIGGVMVFSYYMGNFSEILLKFWIINDELEEGEKLDKFMGVLKNFNGDVCVDISFKKRIWDYFSYRW